MDVFEKTIRDYAELGGGYLSLTPLVGDFFLDRDLIKRLHLLESIPEITSLGVTTNATMAHRFNDKELAYVIGRFDRLSISIYGVDREEYEKMTQRTTYPQMINGIRRVVLASRNPVMLQFRLLKDRLQDAGQEFGSSAAGSVSRASGPNEVEASVARGRRTPTVHSILSMFGRALAFINRTALPPGGRMAMAHLLSSSRQYRRLAALAQGFARRQSHKYLYNWLANEVFPDLTLAEIFARTSINSVIHTYANWGIYSESDVHLPFDASWETNSHAGHKEQCMIPMTACMVFSNGNVSFCPCDNYDDAVELRLGNITEATLSEIYNSAVSGRLWNWGKYGTPRFCQHCSFHKSMAIIAENPSILADPHKLVGAG